jgi:CHAT domain-containing protein
MGRHKEAKEKLDRAIAIYQQLRSVRLADALTARADLYAALGEQDAELNDSRQAYALLKERASVPEAGQTFAEAQRYSARELFALHAIRLAALARDRPELYGEAFAATQEALISRAGDALRRTMQRLSMEGSELARLIGEREDVRASIRQIDNLLSKALTATGTQDRKEELLLRQLRQQKMEDLDRASKLLMDKFPTLAQFEHPAPAELQAVQNALSEDEAALVTVVTEHRLLLWAIRHDGFEVSITSTSADELVGLVSEIRKSLSDALARDVEQPVPEFDRDKAYRLYEAIISPISSSLTGKKYVVFVPDGALHKIPLHLALDRKEDRWFIEGYAVATIPSLNALEATRASYRPSRATKGFLGIGAPSFSGYGRARDEETEGSHAALRSLLSHLPPLPETASELRQIGSLFPASEVTLDLGDRATKEEFVSAPPSAYRNIAFATHAIMAGEAGLEEPAIVLSPDERSVSNGLLTASEIALLRLDADLVVLSACNTAAPDGGPYAEGLSGLARAFMHAGARSMLVSYWAAPRKSTPEITIRFMTAIRADPMLRKAEALRSAILPLLNSGDAELEHPAYWAPFIMVGE